MEAPQGKTDQDREQDRSPAMEVPKGKTDRDREQDSSPGNNLQNAEKLKPNDKAERGETHRNFGIVYQNSSDFHEAIEYHECHLQTAKEGGDKAGQERAYGNLGNDMKGLDDCHKTIECYECHPQTARELGGKAREGRAYGNLGIAYGSLGDYYKAIENHEHHLKIAKQVGDKAGEGGAYGNLGNAYQMLGNFHKAISYHERHLQIAKEVGDTAGEGRALGNLGNAYHSLGENHKAIEYLMHDLQIEREVGDKAGEGRTYGNLGNVYESLSDFHKAIEYHERHLQIAKEVGDKAGEGGAHGNLGNAHQMLGDFRKAIEYHQHNLEIAREVGNKAREGQAYGNLGNAYFSLSDFHKAVEYHKRHLQIARAVGDKAGEGGAYGNLGTAHNSLSDFQKAIAYHERHLQIAREVGDKAGEGRAYGNLGISYDNLGDYDKAIEYHKHYLEIARKVGDKAGEGGAYGNLGNAYHSLGNLEKAIEYHERHLQIAREVGNEAGEGTAYGNLGNAYNSLGDFHKAIEYQKRSQQIAIKVGDRAGEGRACGNLGITYGNLNDFHKAIKYHECHLQKAKEVGDKAGERRACGRLGDAYHSLGNFHKEIEYRKRHLQIAEEVGDKAGEGESYANEEDEVPYYTGRKDLADIEDATVDTDDSEKTLIKSDKIGGTSAQSVKRSIVKRPNLESLSGSPLAARRKRIRQSAAPEEEKPLEVEEFSSRSTDQDVRQKEEAARNVDERKTVIKRGKIADESETWNLARAGASITFNLVAITKSLTITCSLWTPAALSPPIGSNELLVSNVIELSHDGPPDLEFMENASGSINVALLHSASNFKGYEVVIKQLVDPEYNEWEDLETRNIWHSSVNPTVPNWMCPSAEASCSKRWFSSFAAVWRLKSFVFPKPTSKTSEFICPLPDYPNVSVAIPWNSLPADTDFSLTLKVQEAPTIDHDLEGMFVGPILHISCSNNVTLSAPAKISLPLALTDGGIEPAELHSSQVKILHFNSREESQEWTDITDHLDMPVVLRGGIVTFHVKTFCRFWPWLLKTSASIPCKYASLLCDGIMKQQAGFLACLCNDVVPSRYVLNMFCFPRQLRSKVNSDMSSTSCVNMQGEGTSKKPLSSGDETCVSLSNGFEVQGAGNVEKIVLKFHSEHHDHEFLRVSIKDPSDLQVDFLKLLGGEERNNFPIICKVPIIPRSPAQGHVPATFDPEEESSISAQSVKHSVVKHSNIKPSSHSLVTAPRKKICQSAAIEEDEVPYYTVRKKLADKKDSTVDYEENKKTLIKRGKLGGKEDTWHLREAGASIKLNSGAVQQPVPFTCTCLLWNPRTLSPPIASDEILVSSVIELSHDGPPDLEYRESVERLSFTVALLHSAPNLEGYEVVIKQLIDQENNEWKELKTENTWHESETSTVPRWLFPFAQAVCSKSGVSSFAAIWRPKSFTFSRGTAVGPELTCIVPDFPDVSVQIPQSCVPVNQDFCVTIQVQEFPSSKLKGEEGLVGPVLHISGTQNVTLIAPVTIRIPLTLCKGKQELAELCPGELRILHCESLVEPHDWKDITDGLDEPPLLLDGKVQFKVRHFSRFRPVKLRTSRLKSASDFNAFVRKIRRRSRPQYAGFFTCLCETSVPGHFGLRLFCYPQKLQHDVNQKISRCIVPYIGEGTSLRPVCEEEKIFVSLSETIIPQGSDEKNALQFVRFRGNEVYDTGGEVCLGSVSVPKVKFNNQSQELLCNVTMVLASQVPVPFDHEEGTHILRDIYVVKDGEPSDCELEYLSKELGVKWKELGRRLKFNQATLASFDKANEELSEKSFQMLMAWKRKQGCEATYKVLYDALCHELVECKRLAEQFCCRKRS